MSVLGDHGGLSAAQGVGDSDDHGPPRADTSSAGAVLSMQTPTIDRAGEGAADITMTWSTAATEACRRELRLATSEAIATSEATAHDDGCETVNAKHVATLAVRARGGKRRGDRVGGVLLSVGAATLGLGGAFCASLLADHQWIQFFRLATPWTLGAGAAALAAGATVTIRKNKP